MLKPAIRRFAGRAVRSADSPDLSSGYGWAQLAADPRTLLKHPLWIVIVLPM